MPDTLEELTKAVLEGEDELAEELTQNALGEKLNPLSISEAVMAGIQRAGQLWKENIYFQPDVIMSAEAFKVAMEAIEPHLSEGEGEVAGRVLIGTVAGDMHNLGKIMVVAMLRANGYHVTDLGEDVLNETFVNEVRETMPDILGLGCYMNTTMLAMEEVLSSLKETNLRDSVKVMIGGIPTSQEYADKIGADAWGEDAIDVVDKAKQLMAEKAGQSQI